MHWCVVAHRCGADPHCEKILPIMLHGDAAFAGQGIVYETMQMCQLEHFGTSGTMHVICNNQIGFTANPDQTRSTLYASDLGKAFDIPIFHVNADHPEEVLRTPQYPSVPLSTPQYPSVPLSTPQSPTVPDSPRQ